MAESSRELLGNESWEWDGRILRKSLGNESWEWNGRSLRKSLGNESWDTDGDVPIPVLAKAAGII